MTSESFGAEGAGGAKAMNGESRRPVWWRTGLIGVALGTAFLLNGDPGTHAAAEFGIDPLEVLNLQVRNNAFIIFDTSGSMAFPTDLNSIAMGGDDARSRMGQAKVAVRAVVEANRTQMNFGVATYNVLSSDKTLTDGGTNYDGDNTSENGQPGAMDGGLVYVSQDATAALFQQTYRCPDGNTDRPGWFCDVHNSYASYNNVTDSTEVFQSFSTGRPWTGNTAAFWGQAYPAGCTPGTDCFYYLQSRLYRSGVEFVWDMDENNVASRLVQINPITCPLPPAGLTMDNPDDDGDGLADLARPCIAHTARYDSAAAAAAAGAPAAGLQPPAYYYLASGVFDNDSGNNCDGAAVLATVAECTGDNSDDVLDAMRKEIELRPTGSPVGSPEACDGCDFGLGAPNSGADIEDAQPPVAGVRAVQSTPLAGSLNDVRNATPPVFPVDPTGGQQKNFVILITDGDDTCASETGSGPDRAYRRATTVALAAQNLFNPANPPQRRAETFFIAFTTAVSLPNSNRIAQAGSGGTVDSSNGNVSCTPSPTAACRDAFVATNTDELIAALTSAIELAVASGNFAAAPGVIGTVFELVTPPADPLDPDTRYDQRVNLLYQSSFDLPSWGGEFRAFRNDGSAQPLTDPVNFTGLWDAGETLFENVSQVMETETRAGRPANEFTFVDLHDGQDVDSIGTSGTPLIRRRIFTSAGGGRFPRSSDSQFDSTAPAGRNVVALWPPNQAGLSSGIPDIDPPVGTVGPLDDALGVGAGSATVLSFAALRSFFGACDATADPHPVTGSVVPAPALCASNDIDTARKEARQILLAWLAGAELARGSDSKPKRNPVAGVTLGELLYKDRGWLMADSTLSTPAVMTPPLRATPSNHVREWILFRDGRRNQQREGIDEIDLGFGLRNPDFDDSNPDTKLDLKPRMTVVFLGTNLLLHAISAATSEELWGYMPFDLLGNVAEFVRRNQTRDDHIYGVASSIRIADIFVPVPFSVGGFNFDGRWRTFILFGRGPGGKHYTAIDVTAPGPFTRAALETNPPWVAWSRGNPDVDLAGNPVRAADTVPYGFMGQSWSTPAVGNVDLQDAANAGEPEWRAWTGSGYSEDPDEGTVFYALDMVTGDVLDYFNLGDPDPTYIADNALVASPAAWNSFLLDPPRTLNRSPDDFVSRVYIPDLHGRVWKFNATSGGEFFDAGPQHPIADAASLIKLNAGDFVYVGSGHDERLDVNNFTFSVWGLKDIGGDADVTTPAESPPAFTENYLPGFRNRSQPATVFNADGQGRVFFLGQRFNEPGATCLSSFDAFVFALGAETGAYVYDFDGGSPDPGVMLPDRPVQDIKVTGDRLHIGKAGSDYTPDPTSSPSPSPPEDPLIVTVSSSMSSPVCRN